MMTTGVAFTGYIKWLNNSTTFIETALKPENWISQAEAARIRGVSQQAIANLTRRGRLKTTSVAGRTLVLRAEVEGFQPQPKLGRPRKKTASHPTPTKPTKIKS